MLNGKLLGEAFPINKVEVFFDNLDHSNFLGFTWQLISQGKMPIGIDANDSDFNQIGKTGGEKTHTLTIAELASHNHGLNAHTHTYAKVNGSTGYGANVLTGSVGTPSIGGSKTSSVTTSTGGGEGHSHTTSTTTTNTGQANGNTTSSGSGNAHNNMPPYIVMAFWKRIA